MTFVHVWLLGYVNPGRMIEELRGKPAPHWGFYGALLRALGDALLLYLPLALLGRQPSLASSLTFLTTESYYPASVVFMPFFLIAEWLLVGAALHVILRFSGRRTDIDQILNISGMATLVVGALLLVWDWAYILLGGRDMNVLGISHLILSLWAWIIVPLGLSRILDTPIWLGLLLQALGVLMHMPVAVVLVRPPV
jgi:hypothetical protein